MWAFHGDGIATVRIEGEGFFRQSFGLLAEDQAVSRAELGLVIGSVGLGGEEKEFSFIMLIKEFIKILPMLNIDMRPIIKPRPLEVFVVCAESERMDKMQHRICRSAEPGD